jgi:hypothetical protein
MIREAENIIKQRSKAAESRWPLDKLIHHTELNTNAKVSSIPDIEIICSVNFNELISYIAETTASATDRDCNSTSASCSRSVGSS